MIPSPHVAAQAERLVVNYQPGQPTGWPGGNQTTIGGHRSSLDFMLNREAWRISLLSFGQPGDSPDPVYEDVPSDATINFDQVLTNAFGDYYSFTYAAGLNGQNRFSVQSYNVFVKEPTPFFPVLTFGAEVYGVYEPAGGPAVRADRPLQWIQVVNATGAGQPGSFLDNSYRANPYYVLGGLTSINGNLLVNFDDTPQQFISPAVPRDLTLRWKAEAFLVQDTGIKDAGGKEVVNVFGGIKWGWQVRRVQ
jgi:hypothetical protein